MVTSGATIDRASCWAPAAARLCPAWLVLGLLADLLAILFS